MARKSISFLPTYHKKDSSEQPSDRRLRRFSFVPNRARNEFIAFCGEFCGTFMFLLLAFAATQVANESTGTQIPNTSNLLYISLAFAFSLGINVWAFFRISGGLFNPAVTLGLLFVGAITPFRAALVFIAQILSSMCAAAVVSALFPGPLNVSTTLGGGTNTAQGLFIEMFLTAELVFVIFMLAVEKHKATFLAPIAIALALFMGQMAGVYFTGGSLNPARSFGPCVVTGFPHYHWIYWLGPVMGTLLAYGLYRLMKFSEYETANPGQDFNDHEMQLFTPPEDAVTSEEVQRPDTVAESAAQAVQQVKRGKRPTSPVVEKSRSKSNEREKVRE